MMAPKSHRVSHWAGTLHATVPTMTALTLRIAGRLTEDIESGTTILWGVTRPASIRWGPGCVSDGTVNACRSTMTMSPRSTAQWDMCSSGGPWSRQDFALPSGIDVSNRCVKIVWLINVARGGTPEQGYGKRVTPALTS